MSEWERVSAVEDEMTCEDRARGCGNHGGRGREGGREGGSHGGREGAYRQCGKVVMAGGCPRHSAYLGLTLPGPGAHRLSSAVLELSSG